MFHHDSPLAVCRSMDIMPNNAAGPVADIPGGPATCLKAPLTLNALDLDSIYIYSNYKNIDK